MSGESTTIPTGGNGGWRAIVQNCRPLVPVIEAPGGIGTSLFAFADALDEHLPGVRRRLAD